MSNVPYDLLVLFAEAGGPLLALKLALTGKHVKYRLDQAYVVSTFFSLDEVLDSDFKRRPGLVGKFVSFVVRDPEHLPRIPQSAIRIIFDSHRSLQDCVFPDHIQEISIGTAYVKLLDRVHWPKKLHKLELCGHQRTVNLQIPDGVEVLDLGYWHGMNEMIPLIPNGVKTLIFNRAYDQSKNNWKLPPQLEYLHLGFEFNQSIDGWIFPSSLHTLELSTSFNQPIDNIQWPVNLKKLVLGSVNQSLVKVHFPKSLQHLHLGTKFDHPLDGAPPDLEHLELGSAFNQPLTVLPPRLKSLYLGARFDRTLVGVRFPETLKKLHLGNFNQSVDQVTFPCQLEELDFGSHFNQSVNHLILPPGLKRLNMGKKFNQPFDCPLPNGLLFLSLVSFCDHPVDEIKFPETLRELELNLFRDPLDCSRLPQGLQHLNCSNAWVIHLHKLINVKRLWISCKSQIDAWPLALERLTLVSQPAIWFSQALRNLPSTVFYVYFNANSHIGEVFCQPLLQQRFSPFSYRLFVRI